MDVTVVGSCVQDLVSFTPRFPKPGESVRGDKFHMCFGGKGANQAVTAARLGAKVAMVGKVGNDLFGPSTIENFKTNGVQAEGVSITNEAATGTATITVAESGENSIVVVLGANELMTVEDVQKAESLIKTSKVITCQLEIPVKATLEALKLAKRHGVFTIFNPAPGLTDLDPELFKHSDIFCPNENEAEMISGLPCQTDDEISKVLDYFLSLGVGTALVTLGKRGVYYKRSNQANCTHIAAPTVTPVDTTGAGDSFVGSLAYYLSCMPQLSFEDSVSRATQIASLSTTSAGTQPSYPWRKDLPKDLFS